MVGEPFNEIEYEILKRRENFVHKLIQMFPYHYFSLSLFFTFTFPASCVALLGWLTDQNGEEMYAKHSNTAIQQNRNNQQTKLIVGSWWTGFPGVSLTLYLFLLVRKRLSL
jgi:hypothetical protein